MKKFSDFLKERCWPGYKSVPGKKAYSPGSCMKEEDMEEGWSQKYKSSINCSHPKGFSQKAHCAGKKKHNENHEVMEMTCPDCGMCQTHGNVNESAAAAIAAATAIAKKKSGNYDSEGMRKTPYKNPDSPNRKSNAERRAELKEDLRKWFSKTDPAGGWKRINSKGEAIGPCAREPGEPKPKCMSNEKRASLTKKERASAVAAKRKHDPNPERQGKPINVSNFGKGKISEDMENLDEKNVPTSPEKWAQAKAQAKAKFDVYPSAYANGWAAKKYKSMGGGWKSVSEESQVDEGAVPAKEKTVTVRHKTSGKELVVTAEKAKQLKQQDYHPIKEAIKDKFDIGEYDQEGDMAKSDLRSIMANAKRVHDMLEDSDNLPEWVQSKITLAEDYMSTVANYMTSEMSEETDAIGLVKPKTSLTAAAKTLSPDSRMAEESKPPFDKPYTTVKGTITDKSGAKHTPMSRARDIARMAMKKQVEKMKQPVKESLDESRRMEIVREAMKVAKKKKETIVSDDKYQADPMLSSQINKT